MALEELEQIREEVQKLSSKLQAALYGAPVDDSGSNVDEQGFARPEQVDAYASGRLMIWPSMAAILRDRHPRVYAAFMAGALQRNLKGLSTYDYDQESADETHPADTSTVKSKGKKGVLRPQRKAAAYMDLLADWLGSRPSVDVQSGRAKSAAAALLQMEEDEFYDTGEAEGSYDEDDEIGSSLGGSSSALNAAVQARASASSARPSQDNAQRSAATTQAPKDAVGVLHPRPQFGQGPGSSAAPLVHLPSNDVMEGRDRALSELLSCGNVWAMSRQVMPAYDDN